MCFDRAAPTPLDGGVETKFLSRVNRGDSPSRLKINRYLSCFGTGKNGRFRSVHDCVFFTQHSPEKRQQDLWEGGFFIA